MLFRLCLIVFTSTISLMSFAQDYQENHSIALKEVTVRSARQEEFAVGAVIEKSDTLLIKALKAASVSDLLTISSGAAIKSYGPGGLSSISIRGGGSAHTAVMWNGINIQSPMNSSVNFTSMPVSFFKNIQVQQGGSGTLFGSGAMSGVVHLSGQNLFKEPDGIETVVGFGSFKNKNILVSGKTGNQKVASSISVFGQMADNDFRFKNTTKINSPIERQTNAGLTQVGFIQENHIRFSETTLLTSAFWYQHYDKDVQTQMTNSRPGKQNQVDDNILSSLNFRVYGNGYTLNFKQGLVYNKIDFSNPDIPTSSSISHSVSLISEAECRIQINSHYLLNVGLNYTHDYGKSQVYSGSVNRDRVGIFSFFQMKHFNDRLLTVLSAREEASNGQLHPVVFSIGNDWAISKAMTVKTNLSRNYRIPSLNDLYWLADAYAKGNPDLVPESGWSGEAGLFYNKRSRERTTELSALFFFTKVENWIVWLQEGGIWMPTNKKSGRSNGIETRASKSLLVGKTRLSGQLSYYYTFSQLGTDDNYDGQQMIYIPRHKASGLFTASKNQFSGGFAINYTGERYYDYINTIEGYLTGDVFANWRLALKTVDIDLGLRANNIWDTNYQVMAFFAMPQRNYSATIGLRF